MPGPPAGFIIDEQPPSQAAAPSRGAPPPGFAVDESKDEQRDRERRWSDVPGEALSNVPSSAMKFGENLIQPIVHPIDTATNMKNLALGLAEYAGGIKDGSHKKYADAVGQMIKDRYGSMDSLKRTLATDPVGALADFSSVLTGGGAALRGAEAVGRAAGATRTANVAGAVGRGLADVGAEAEPLRTARNVGSAVKEAVAPTGRRAAVNELSKAGVEMTPGQRAGGVAKYVEDKAAALPFLSDVVRHGQNMSTQSFNRVIGDRALMPIGERVDKTTKAGHNLIAEVGSKISGAYDRLLPRLVFKPDARLAARLGQIFNNRVRNLPQPVQDQFRSIMMNYVRNRNYPMPGQHYKILESELGQLADKYMKSANTDQRLLGEALGKVHEAARGALLRSNRNNPQAVAQLQRINTSWAMFKRMEDAATRRAGSEGVFTASDMLQASRGASRKGPFARGNAIFQKFGEAAQKVLPRQQPESGTPGGQIIAGGLAAGLGVAGTAAGAHALGQLAAIGKGALYGAPVLAAYTKPGMRAFNKMARNQRGAASARNAAVQAGRLPDEEQANQRQPLRFTVPPSRPGEVLAPPRDALSP